MGKTKRGLFALLSILAVLVCIAMLAALCPTASAGYYGDGCPFDNWFNGTLHGGIYFQTKGHYTQAGETLNETFEDVPDERRLVRLYLGVWLGSPQAGRVTTFTITINGHSDAYTFEDTRSGCWDPPLCDLVDEPECNADYTGCGVVSISYNASPYVVTGTNYINVSTSNEQFYHVALFVIYENESMPEIQYWVREGGQEYPDDNYTLYFNETVNTGRIYTGSIQSLKFWTLGYPHCVSGEEWPTLNENYLDACDYVYSYDAGGAVHEGSPPGKEYEVLYRWDNIPPGYITAPDNRFYYPKLGNDRMMVPVLMLNYSEPSELNVTDISPESLCVDYYNTIDATIVNNGGAARLFNATLYVNGTKIDVKQVSNLGEGENRTVKFLWKPGVTGSYVLNVTADVENVIKETDKTNNSKIEAVEVKVAQQPEWQRQSSNVSSIPNGSTIELKAQGRADLGLDHAILYTNETGIWINHTIYGSPLDLDSYYNYSLTRTSKTDWKAQTLDNLSVIGDDITLCRMVGTANLALNQPAYADSYYYPPENANDGDSTTAWLSQELNQSWWYVDLGEVKDIQQIKIDFYDAFGGAPYKYTVDISNEHNTNWTTKIEKSVGFDETFDNLGWSCRYIRVNILDALGASPYVAIAEFEAYPPGDYKSSGTLRSKTVAATDHPIVSVTPTWNSTEPTGTSISVNVSVDNGATWKTAVNSEELTWDYDVLNNTKLKYMVLFNTGDVNKTPVLHDITLEHKTRNPVEGTWLWSNFTWQNASITGKTVGWKICYADTLGKTNCTDVMTFYVGAAPVPPPELFDTGPGTYPSIMGVHNGTITPEHDISVARMYTYPCKGTGGHSEYIKIWNGTGRNVSATWTGYAGDWHNISFDESFTLEGGKTYNYTIITGSYPQIIHAKGFNATGGEITCVEFVDANGRSYNDWIPAIRLSAS